MRNDKTKDMIRSILPSKSRRRARFMKAHLNRQTRHAVRIDLHAENLDADLDRQSYFGEMVGNRRGSDKLNHFMRWCEAVTEGMTTQEALDHVRALLPDSLIGDHAYGHWAAHRKPYPSWLPVYRSNQRRLQSFVDSTTFRLRRALAIDPELHARLNAEIKRRAPVDAPRRLLGGAHDVEAFVRDIAETALERKITLELIEQIERQKGGRKAALRVSCAVILSRIDGEGSPNTAIRILRSFAVYAAQDDGTKNGRPFGRPICCCSRSASRRVRAIRRDCRTRWCCRSNCALSNRRSNVDQG